MWKLEPYHQNGREGVRELHNASRSHEAAEVRNLWHSCSDNERKNPVRRYECNPNALAPFRLGLLISSEVHYRNRHPVATRYQALTAHSNSRLSAHVRGTYMYTYPMLLETVVIIGESAMVLALVGIQATVTRQ